MSYIPCIREKYKTSIYTKEEKEKELNAYWQGFLNDQGIETLNTYDFTVDIVENFFENLEVYQDEFADVIDRYKNVTGKPATINMSEDDMLITDVVNTELFNKDDDFSEEDIKSTSLPVLLARTMYECMMHWLDMHRDELGVSMLDGMGDAEYENLKDAVLHGIRTNKYTEES